MQEQNKPMTDEEFESICLFINTVQMLLAACGYPQLTSVVISALTTISAIKGHLYYEGNSFIDIERRYATNGWKTNGIYVKPKDVSEKQSKSDTLSNFGIPKDISPKDFFPGKRFGG